MKSFLKKSVFLVLLLGAAVFLTGCVSCLPQYAAPPNGPASTVYPVGHDPYIPMDHNPTVFNPWDLLSSVGAMFMYGPPR